jgi:hypothetical protein
MAPTISPMKKKPQVQVKTKQRMQHKMHTTLWTKAGPNISFIIFQGEKIS